MPLRALGEITIVTLNNFYLNVQNPYIGSFFHKMAVLRAKGFGSEYPETFLPLDTCDFICWHHLICTGEPDNLTPIAGFRQVSLEICEHYKMKLPLLKFIEEAKAFDHATALNAFCARFKHSPEKLVYSSAMAIVPEHRGNPAFSKFFKEISAALYYKDSMQFGIEASVCGAALKYKVQQLFKSTGYKPLTLNGIELPAIPNITADNQPLLLMTLEQISDWAKECYFKHQHVLMRMLFLGENFT